MELSFILVEPAVPENIGASARAIKTMGFSSLCLVNPVNHLDKKAKILAHASNDILENANVYSNFKELISEFDFLIATSSKRRRTNENYILAEDLPDFLNSKSESINRVGIVFGREESGLSNAEIKACDIITCVSLANPYPSLNLSQAVMIYAFLLSGVDKKNQQKITGEDSEASLQVLKERVNKVLDQIKIKQQHIIGPRIMERMSHLKKEDINLLHSLSNTLLDRIKKNN
jgi:tRNA/rRNA methyltransferase